MSSFLKDVQGAIAINFALFGLVGLMVVGVALDWSVLVKKRQNIQTLADTAVLAAAMSPDQDIATLELITNAMVKSRLPEDAVITVNPTNMNKGPRSTETSSMEPGLRVELSYVHQPIVASVLGKDMLRVFAASEAAVRGNKRLNIALVLDTTRSMRDEGRLEALQEASSDLITHLENLSQEPGDIKVSVVPFADYVRIDPALRDEPWLNAQEDRLLEWQVVDLDKSIGCEINIINERPVRECETTVFRTKSEVVSWVGCMASRMDGFHTEAKFLNREMQGPGGRIRCDEDNNIMQPLTADLASVRETIDNFQTDGQTYIPSGLIWGWRTLDPDLPFDESSEDAEETQNILILMTDGSNTISLNGLRDDFEGIYHWGVNGEGKNEERANILTQELCDSIKFNDIEIITVALSITDANTLNLLQDCASNLNNHYNAMDSDRLVSSFNAIGAELGQVRLTR